MGGDIYADYVAFFNNLEQNKRTAHFGGKLKVWSQSLAFPYFPWWWHIIIIIIWLQLGKWWEGWTLCESNTPIHSLVRRNSTGCSEGRACLLGVVGWSCVYPWITQRFFTWGLGEMLTLLLLNLPSYMHTLKSSPAIRQTFQFSETFFSRGKSSFSLHSPSHDTALLVNIGRFGQKMKWGIPSGSPWGKRDAVPWQSL